MSDRLPHEYDPATERQIRITLDDDADPGQHPSNWYGRATVADLTTLVENTVNLTLHVSVPGGVAEHYRQQGRRELQAELRALINVRRA